jgi:hypothetical protein
MQQGKSLSQSISNNTTATNNAQRESPLLTSALNSKPIRPDNKLSAAAVDDER